MIIEFMKNMVDIYLKMAPYMVMGLLFVGILHVYVSKERIMKVVGKNSLGSVIKASIIGVPLPLCSCGVIPTGIELKKAGASNGAVVSFLTSTPQTGVDSLIATYGMMGPFMAVFRAIAAFISGVFGGIIVNIFNKEEKIEEADTGCCCKTEEPTCTCGCGGDVKEKKSVKKIFTYSFGEFLDEIAVHFVIGILVAGLITTLIPEDFFVTYGLNDGIVSILLMILVGIPMYICSTSSIPVAVAFLIKGISPGAAFAFLFAGPVTNAASIILLGKTIGKKMTAIYVASASFMALVFGMLLNFLVDTFGFEIKTITGEMGSMTSIFTNTVSVVFLLILIWSIGKKLLKRREEKKIGECKHCS
jgi:uncharacterized membrane protein YraQ (UPF0718 family)